MWRSSFNWFRSSWIGRKLTNGKYESPVANSRQDTSPESSNIYLVCVEDILSCRNKTRSLIGVVVTYIAVWLLYWMTTRPYFVLSLCILVNLARDAWLNYLWPEISLPGRQPFFQIPRLKFEMGEELSCHLLNVNNNLVKLIRWILDLRTNNNGLFTIVVSAVCLGVAGIGSIFPGIIWAHLVFAIGWATQLGLNTPTFFQLSKEDSRYHAEFEDLIPQLSDDEIQVLEKAKEANFQSESMVVDDTFHLSTIPTLDELDGDTTITAGELNFVASHFDDDLDDFVPTGVRLDPRTSDIGNMFVLKASAISDSTNEDFEVISDSDLDY